MATETPVMPAVGSPTPPELVGLPRGTTIDVFVDGVVRTGTIVSDEKQFDDNERPFESPLVPGYWIGLPGSFAGVKARNIVRVHPPAEQRS